MAVELLGHEQAIRDGADPTIREILPPTLGDGLGIAGVLLEDRLGVGSVLAVEAGLVHGSAERGAPPVEERSLKVWKSPGDKESGGPFAPPSPGG